MSLWGEACSVFGVGKLAQMDFFYFIFLNLNVVNADVLTPSLGALTSESYTAFVKQSISPGVYTEDACPYDGKLHVHCKCVGCYDSVSVYRIHFTILMCAVASYSLFRWNGEWYWPTSVAALPLSVGFCAFPSPNSVS
jgi:hypothetical protein